LKDVENVTIQTDLSALNESQKAAVLTEDKRVLVLAGAGSGKTKTLLQKLVYLINDKGVRPSNVLAITFTRNAANEMIDRLIISVDETGDYERIIQNKRISAKDKEYYRYTYSKKYGWINNVTVRTFHGMCYYILRNYGAEEFDNKFKVISDKKPADDQLDKNIAPETDFEIMHKMLIEACDDPQYLLQLKRYILDFFVDKIHFSRRAARVGFGDGRYYTTLKGECVRSKSERDIADWFYRHNIKYYYEPKLRIKDFNFRPDFYIPQANMYLEHVSDKSYYMKNKEEQFEIAGKLCVYTYEAMTEDSNLFNRALDRIIKGRLSDHCSPEVALSFEEEFRSYHEDVKDFVKQVLRVVDMVKVENLSFDDIFAEAQKDQHERIRGFYELAYPLFSKYSHYCINRSYLDFNDMIIRTLALFKNQPEIRQNFQKKYKYVLVDEFQDVNKLQVEFINQLLLPESRLFCVGDDWQSIYGFRGSEVDYIINFDRYFDDAKIIKLRLNYRSTENIVCASNEVIRHNKYKVDKEIRASKKSKSKIHVYAANNVDDGVRFFVEEVKRLLSEGYSHEDILVLYRRSKMFKPYYRQIKNNRLGIKGKTIHASKGLEARAVFIIGLTEGRGGFPDIWLDDRIFQVVRKAKHDLLLEEERRLFYVALTRAKDELYLITEKGNESSFLGEIPEKYFISFKRGSKPLVDRIVLCDNCKKQIEEHYSFCPNCGVRVEKY